ncbi:MULTISPECIES: AMP-dependent synthetase/ligase [unclassified Sphingomonas]|uniref:AMP-dependent synthetase/ligase n=1 Tax=unclassified Sphingomonas TaxID=196159 RepID=UPI0006FC1105|nr:MULTISPECIES: AMP-binding protein [unclassified Sphingomonas]KQX18572.1 AMP-dependent synthetase [Sphingomonas sp. Root1294]KQY72104.1 AMP-dependent synthetase [Sphingomonas sp. Root50]KRB94626.1 AMP-dependent synthetase [Sphingomonas sp. Root720]
MSTVHPAAFDDDTLPSLLRDRRDTISDQAAFFQKRGSEWHRTNWGEFARKVSRLSRALLDSGLKKGDYVAIMGDVSQEWVIAFMATACAGGVAVGIYFTSSAEEVDYYLVDCGARFMFVAGEKELRVALRASRATALEKIITFDSDVTPADNVLSLSAFAASASNCSALLDEQAEVAGPDDMACVVYTSGTTANPKGAMLTHRSLIEGVATTRCFCPALFTEAQRVVVHLPISHVVGLGQGIVLPLISRVLPYFGESSADFAATIREVKPTYWMAPPRFYQRYAAELASKINASSPAKRKSYHLAMSIGQKALADRQAAGPGSSLLQALFETCREEVFIPLLAEIGLHELKYPYTASAPMSSDVMKLWQTWGLNLKECYGQTELVGANAAQLRDWSQAGTIGEAIADPRWKTRVAGDGEMLVKGPGLFIGYLNKPDDTVDALRDGWLHTGDIVELRPDGLLALIDRKKEIINTSGGKSISPAQIENELRQSPYISEAAVCGDGRKYLVALIEVDRIAMMDWAKERVGTINNYSDLCTSEAVIHLIEGEVAKANQKLAQVEQIKAFRILHEELTVENGVMTATRKKRRKKLNDRYKEIIDSLYDDSEESIIRKALL